MRSNKDVFNNSQLVGSIRQNINGALDNGEEIYIFLRANEARMFPYINRSGNLPTEYSDTVTNIVGFDPIKTLTTVYSIDDENSFTKRNNDYVLLDEMFAMLDLPTTRLKHVDQVPVNHFTQTLSDGHHVLAIKKVNGMDGKTVYEASVIEVKQNDKTLQYEHIRHNASRSEDLDVALLRTVNRLNYAYYSNITAALSTAIQQTESAYLTSDIEKNPEA